MFITKDFKCFFLSRYASKKDLFHFINKRILQNVQTTILQFKYYVYYIFIFNKKIKINSYELNSIYN